jgi:transcriptional antiterminator RfaH
MESMSRSADSLCRWHLAFTKPLAEEVAKVHLERQGYRVYLPRVQQKTFRRGKWGERIVALFPRYLFVQLDAALQSLAPIRSTVGIASIVRFGVDFTVVPDRIVRSLAANEDPETKLHKLPATSSFKAGAAVRITKGALSGLEGIFECEDANDRVTVLLNLLGREARVKIESGFVVATAN